MKAEVRHMHRRRKNVRTGRLTCVVADGTRPRLALLLVQPAHAIALLDGVAIVEHGVELLVQLDAGLPHSNCALQTTSCCESAKQQKVLINVAKVVVVVVVVDVVVSGGGDVGRCSTLCSCRCAAASGSRGYKTMSRGGLSTLQRRRQR
eukprot:570519-Pleurochrysis_carterae.AAC.1